MKSQTNLSDTVLISQPQKKVLALSQGFYRFLVKDYTNFKLELKIDNQDQKDLKTKIEIYLSSGASLDLEWVQYLSDIKIALEILVVHQGRDSQSQILTNCYLDNDSYLDLQAQVVIDKLASFSQTETKLKSVLLSSRAKAVNKPILRIYNDQVQARHGAVVSGLDPETQSYLASRGLNFQLQKRLYQDSLKKATLDEV